MATIEANATGEPSTPWCVQPTPAPQSSGHRCLLALGTWLMLVLGLTVPALAQGPLPAYQKGAKAFKEGRYESSYRILFGVVRKYPDHQPSHLLLGRILYQNGRIAKAAKFFRRVSADLLPAEAAYEYGITMFSAKDCKRALAGFSRVPAKSRYANYAAFYRGICYMRLGDYERAQIYLGRARRLPSNLESSRRQALAQTRRALRADRRATTFAPSSPYLVAPAPVLAPIAAPPAAGKAGATRPGVAKQAPSKPAPSSSSFSYSLTPSLSLTRKSTTTDYHGYATDEGESDETDLKLSFKSKYDAAAWSTGGQPYLSLGLEVGQKQASSRGTKIKYIAYENDPGTLVEQVSDSGPTSANTGTLKAVPEAGVPLTSVILLTGGYSLTESYPDLKADEKTSARGPYGALDFVFDVASFKMSGSQTDAIGPRDELIKTTTVLTGELSKNWESAAAELELQQSDLVVQTKPPPSVVNAAADSLTADMTTQMITGKVSKNWDTFTLSAMVANTTYVVGGGYVKGAEDSSLKTEISGSKSFDFGGVVSFTASIAKLSGYKKLLEDKVSGTPVEGKYPTKLFTSEATSQSILSSFKLAPLDWLFGAVSYKYTKQAFALANIRPYPEAGSVTDPAAGASGGDQSAEYEALFQQSVPEVLTEFNIQVGVSKTF